MLGAMKKHLNYTFTENGAKAYATTTSDVLDLFAQAGAMRNRSEFEIISLFTKAFSENPLLAMKALFYFRDIRGGQGERRTFKLIAKHLVKTHKKAIQKNIHLIPEFGRWDDLYVFFDTELEGFAGEIIKEQFEKDMKSASPSLLGKWLKSENASSKETKRLAVKTRKILGLSPAQYRKSLSKLRKQINIVERLMSAGQWDAIEYDKLTSKAGLLYRSAFYRNDEERYQDFVNALASGEKKVNSSTLYPYELVQKAYYCYYHERELLNGMWNNLPNYIGEEAEDSIAVVDVSGSMSGTPMDVAISLGLYMAERNKGAYKDHFITFSEQPEIVQVKGDTFVEKVQNMKRAKWGYGTNVEAVFKLILDVAKANKLPQEDMVKKLYIITDMEFNSSYIRGNSDFLFEIIREEFEEAGYQMPKLIFWNVDARNTQFPFTAGAEGVTLVSGFSPSIFTNLMRGNFATPYDMMLDVLMDERYKEVTI